METANIKDAHIGQLTEYYKRVVDVYDSSYTGIGRYRSNYFRLRILVALLERTSPRPSLILDAGCGDARPLAEMLRLGFDVRGFDISDAMLEAGETILQNQGFDHRRIDKGNIYDIPAPDQSYEAISCMGVVENLPDHERIFSEFRRVLKPDGRLFISLENDLFSLFSVNKYSIRYLAKLFEEVGVPSAARDKAMKDLEAWNNVTAVKSIKKTFEDAEIDKSKVVIPSYNPLNAQGELRKLGFALEELRFFHYHPLPPRFEVEFPEVFQELAESLETVEYDWRGGILCNCMVAQAKAL
jgi:ubiquinone/menaquinone biosynthesis C-methylase UbiE